MRPSGLQLIRITFWCSATVLAIASLVPVTSTLMPDVLPVLAAMVKASWPMR